MGGKSERRSLFYANDDNFDPTLVVDVNEYLIDEWPGLTLKQRRSVWTIAQGNDDFDYDPIYNQIDEIIYEMAETDSTIELPPEDDDDTESEEPILELDVEAFLEDNWPNLTEDQSAAIVEIIMSDYDEDELNFDGLYEVLDSYVVKYAKTTDSSIDLSQLDELKTESE